MINVVGVGQRVSQLMAGCNSDDLNITVVEPEDIDKAVLEIIAADADITLMDQHNERLNSDILCLVLATN